MGKLVKFLVVSAVAVFSLCTPIYSATPKEIEKMTNMLFDAIRYDEIERVKLAIKGGANLNEKRYRSGVTPLMCTMLEPNVGDCDDMAELLINAGADVNAKDNRGETVLMKAVYDVSHKNIMKQLIEAGADVNAKDNEGETVLMKFSGLGGDYKLVNLLINVEADVNAKANNGTTALKEAFKYDEFFAGGGMHKNIILRLRAAGATE